ncbi:MAG: ATP-binding protein [Bacteroidota bacterium]
MNSSIQSSPTLSTELHWFIQILNTRNAHYFDQETDYPDIASIPVPDISGGTSPYANWVRQFKLNPEERLVLMLALAPYLKPQILDIFFTKNAAYDRPFTEFGGVQGKTHLGFLPTGETVLFLLAGKDMDKRTRLQYLFDPEHVFRKQNILQFSPGGRGEPLWSGQLILSREALTYLTTGEEYVPDFSQEFPAKKISTKLTWEELVLEPKVMAEVQEIQAWIQHGQTLMKEWELGRTLKPGFRSLFYGPPGTGKTLTASLLGKSTGHDAFRVDLSQVVSKYIGETEKNLSNIFDLAENKQWILFFDEADALFGKRTTTQSSHDRYANQEVSYLLQRVEDFAGVVILASNFKSNLDEAFARRFQSTIYFPMPGPEQRFKLWQQSFSKHTELEAKINLRQIAQEHELSGGMIINIVRYSSLMAISRNENIIRHQDLIQGIRKEFMKTGKTLR